MPKTILVVANETIGGRALIETVLARNAEGNVRFRYVVPRSRPRHGNVIYAEAVRDSAQVRVDLAELFMRQQGVSDVHGEVGDSDPFNATMDAIAEYRPDEVIVSTKPAISSGWLRRDLPERIREAGGLPVEHIVVDTETGGMGVHVTLVIANQTVGDEQLVERLRSKAKDGPQVFIVVMPQDSGQGRAAAEARKRLDQTLERLRGEGLVCSGMIGDPDPYTATMNALQTFHIDDIVISTFGPQRSGWLRADLIERVRRSSGRPVEHVLAESGEPVESS